MTTALIVGGILILILVATSIRWFIAGGMRISKYIEERPLAMEALRAQQYQELKHLVEAILSSGAIKTIVANEICLAGAKPGDEEYNPHYAINIGSANGWFNAYGERKIIDNPSEKSLTDEN